MSEELAPDGRPMVGPFDRAGWRDWLIGNHVASAGVYLVSWRRPTDRTSVPYEEAVEEALCVGWVDSTGRVIDEERSIQWFAPRRPRSAWARSNKERVERLTAAGLMLPAGLAAIDDVTDMKIEAISLLVGCKSKATFYRLVRQFTGHRPADIRLPMTQRRLPQT